MDVKQKNIGKGKTIVNNESGTVNVNTRFDYADLSGDSNVQIYKTVSKTEQRRFLVGLVAVCILPSVSLVADLMQIHPAINLPFWVYVVVFGTIFLVGIIGFYDNLKLALSIKPPARECRWLYGDRLYTVVDDGYVIFTHVGKCICPGCSGTIRITNPPERYNGNFLLFGECSLAGKQHSYGIDYNLQAYPREVDWRQRPSND